MIVFVIVSTIIRRFIFGSGIEDASFEEDISVFMKFYLAGIIKSTLLVLSVFTKKKQMCLFFILTGSIFVILGARSSGLTSILTGMIAYTVVSINSINWKRLMILSIFILLTGYGAYTIYVNKVLNGEIISGNSQQLTQIKNPYNPLLLLMRGRAETVVGMEAFMDKFWTGHGAWAKDVTDKYLILLLLLHDSDKSVNDIDSSIIPAHSVLVGAGMQNGVFAFVFMFMILYFFLKKGFIAISKTDPYIIIIVSFIMSILWNGLFSPTTHFRLSLPVGFAILLTSYLINMKKHENLFFNNR
jgi:hypothetical protein